MTRDKLLGRSSEKRIMLEFSLYEISLIRDALFTHGYSTEVEEYDQDMSIFLALRFESIRNPPKALAIKEKMRNKYSEKKYRKYLSAQTQEIPSAGENIEPREGQKTGDVPIK
jgi:hypothetical protein